MDATSTYSQGPFSYIDTTTDDVACLAFRSAVSVARQSNWTIDLGLENGELLSTSSVRALLVATKTSMEAVFALDALWWSAEVVSEKHQSVDWNLIPLDSSSGASAKGFLTTCSKMGYGIQFS